MADTKIYQEKMSAERVKQGHEQTQLEQFRTILLKMPAFKTSYGEIVNFRVSPLSRWALDESKEIIRNVFGEPVADFGQKVPEEIRSTLEQGVYIYEKSAYYLKKSPSGTNMMEVRPWSSSVQYGIYLAHVPHVFVKVNRIHHNLETMNEYRNLMKLASFAENYETNPKILLDIVVQDELRREIEYLFEKEWKQIANKGEETPPKYQLLFDRIDPFFRFRSQPLYAQRHDHGICIAVHRQWNEPEKVSIVAQYIPDAFRFSADTVQGASGIAGRLHQCYGILTPSGIEGLIEILKGEL